MLRDYSEQKLLELQNYVNLDVDFWEFLGDAISDLLLYLRKISGFLDIDNAENVSAYQRDVIDMHNYTCKELIDIFQAVDQLDQVFGARIDTSVTEPLIALSKTLQMYVNQINPQSSGGLTVAGIQSIAQKAKEVLDPVWEKANIAFDATLKEKAEHLAAEAGKQMLLSTLSFAADCISLLRTGDVLYLWDMLDDFTEFKYALGSEIDILGGLAGREILTYMGNDQAGRVWYADQLDKAEKDLEIDSTLKELSTLLDDAGFKEDAKAVRILDDGSRVVRTGIKLYKGLSKGLDSKFGDASKVNPDAIKEPTPIKKAEVLKDKAKEIQSGIEAVKGGIEIVDAYTEDKERGLAEYYIDESQVGKYPKKVGKLKGKIDTLVEDGAELYFEITGSAQ